MGRASTEDLGYDEVAGVSLLVVLLLRQQPLQKSDATAHSDFGIRELQDMKMQLLLERASTQGDLQGIGPCLRVARQQGSH